MTTDFAKMLIGDMRAHDGVVTTGPMAGRPLMVLTTTGAQSGQERTAIVTYTRDGDRFVIAGVNGGSPSNPAWFFNLVANPEVTVEAAGETFEARAAAASGDERDRLWAQHVSERPEFSDYQKQTERKFPMIVLMRMA